MSSSTWSETAAARVLQRNPRVAEPSPPGPWVNGERCRCGALYRDHRAGLSFADARAELVAMGFPHISRGPVLWWLHVFKLADWYGAHSACGLEDLAGVTPGGERRCDTAPAACPCAVACPWCTERQRRAPCAAL